MRQTLFLLLAICSVVINEVHPLPLTVVPGKSGEQQVKEALDKAERESEEAAKAATNSTKVKGPHAKESSTKIDTDSDKKDKAGTNTDSKTVVTETKPSDESSTNTAPSKVDTELKASEKGDLKTEKAVAATESTSKQTSSTVSTEKAKTNETTESTTSDSNSEKKLHTDSDNSNPKLSESTHSSSNENTKDSSKGQEKTSETVSKLNSRLSAELTKEGEKKPGKDLELEKENEKLEEESNRKMTEMAKKLNNLVMRFQHKLAAGVDARISREKLIQALQKLDRLRNRAHGALNGDTEDKRRRGKTANLSPLDLSSLAQIKRAKANGQIANQYKEDTKLEDRLAMEAEEERKFNNGETYESDDDLTGEAKQTQQFSTSSLSPKEQASQEMQSYNALISSESNRELSQIQEEIAKTSQAGMGQVSVEGENQNVPVEGSQSASSNGAGGLASQLGSSIAAQLGAQLNGGNLANQLTGSVENSLSSLATGAQGLESQQGTGGLEQAGTTIESLDTGGTTGSEVSQAINSIPEMGGGQETSQYQPGITSIQQGQSADAGGLSQQLTGATQAIEAGGITESLQGLGAAGGNEGGMESLTSQASAGALGGGSLQVLSGQNEGGGLSAGLGGGLLESARFSENSEPQVENPFMLQQSSFKKSKISSKEKAAAEGFRLRRGSRHKRLGKHAVGHKKGAIRAKKKSASKKKRTKIAAMKDGTFAQEKSSLSRTIGKKRRKSTRAAVHEKVTA